MDNLRGHFPDYEEGHDSADFDPADDDIGGDLPPAAIGQDERRMQVRASNFWASLLADRNYPSNTDFDPASQTDFGPYSILLDFTADVENPAIAYLGNKLALECDSDEHIEHLSDVPSRSLLSRITDHYLQIIANQAPIGFEAEFVNQRGATILYRGILLPFSSDGTTIDFIYGVINWKGLADQQTADELLLQIDQALESNRRAAREDLPMTEWADGALELDTPLADPVRDLPVPAFSAGNRYASLDRMAARSVPAISSDPSLGELLIAARDQADEAANCEKRTHLALYDAIGTAHDFVIAARTQSQAYAAMLADAGLRVQDRAPMVPVVKLVFGLGYDKTRVAEYAAVLDHATRLGLAPGELATLLCDTAGGLKALVTEERRLRKQESGKPDDTSRQQALSRKLRALPGQRIEQLPAYGAEFTLLVARRGPAGGLEILGEIGDDPALVEKAARRLVG